MSNKKVVEMPVQNQEPEVQEVQAEVVEHQGVRYHLVEAVKCGGRSVKKNWKKIAGIGVLGLILGIGAAHNMASGNEDSLEGDGVDGLPEGNEEEGDEE